MKSAFDTVEGKITDYDEITGEMTIKAHYPDFYTFVKRGYKRLMSACTITGGYQTSKEKCAGR